MTLIELFTDYIRNRKSLVDYVEERKGYTTRGEFPDETLIQTEAYLQRLKEENPKVYEGMYQTLEHYIAEDNGHYVEYPLNFVRQILQIYEHGIPAQKVYDIYRAGLQHKYRDPN